MKYSFVIVFFLLFSCKLFAQDQDSTKKGLVFNSKSFDIDLSNIKDQLDPAQFIRIEECEQSHEKLDCDKPILLFGREPLLIDKAENVDCSDDKIRGYLKQRVRDYVNPEVDKDSRVVISFDRIWLQCASPTFEAEISMRGSLVAENKPRNIEVPGYYLTGEESKSSSARLRSANEIVDLILDLEANYSSLYYQISELVESYYLKVLPSNSPVRFGSGNYQGRSSLSFSDIREFASIVALTDIELVTLRDGIDDLGETEKEISDLDSGFDFLFKSYQRTRESSIDSVAKAASLEELGKRLDENREERLELSGDSYSIVELNDRHEFLLNLRQIVVNRRNRIELILDKLSDESNEVLLRALVAEVDPIESYRNVDFAPLMVPELVVKSIEDIKSVWFPQIVEELDIRDVSASDYEKLVVGVYNLLDILFDLRIYLNVDRGDLETTKAEITNLRHGIRQYLIQELKNTNLLLGTIGAEKGDRVNLIIENNARSNELPRRLGVNLSVQEFGTVVKTTDSFFLLKKFSDRKITTTTATDSMFTQTESAQFVPTAGASLSWTHYGRGKFMRFVKPGFGINVSFPVSSTKVTRFENSSLIVEGEETSSSPTVAISEESKSEIDIGAGVYFSLFDNQIQFTFGTVLTDGEKFKDRAYFGIGFSFVNFVRRISSDSE